jgi:hypothetical protein
MFVLSLPPGYLGLRVYTSIPGHGRFLNKVAEKTFGKQNSSSGGWDEVEKEPPTEAENSTCKIMKGSRAPPLKEIKDWCVESTVSGALKTAMRVDCTHVLKQMHTGEMGAL